MSLADDVRARRGDPDDPFDQDAAKREYSREARRRDRARADEHARARKAGRAGGGRSEFADDPELLNSYDEGAASSSSSSSAGRSVSMPKLDVVSDGSGVLLGVIVYVLVLNYIRGGPQAVRGWFSAKFLNKPYTGAQLGAVTPSAPAAPDFGTGRANGTGPVIWHNIYPQYGGGGVTR